VAIRDPIDSGARCAAKRLRTEFLPAPPKSSAAQPNESEFDLLCALAGKDLTAKQIERLAHWDYTAIDWKELLRLAEQHGVLPLAARNLIEHGCELPAEIEQSLRSDYETNLRRSLWFTAELARIAQQFESRQLTVVPYKGPALAQSLYGDPGLRSFSDLDFLVSAADFERAKQALAELGYHPSNEFSPAVERLWLRTGNECSFDSAAGKNLVELQWRVLPHFYAVDLDVPELQSRAGRAVVGGCEMPSLSPEDLLLVLCLHAAKHLWTRLIWTADIAETLRTLSINYAQVLERGRERGIVRMLGISFWLVKNVLRVELPEQAEEIAADPQVPILGAAFAERLSRGTAYDFESTEYFRLIRSLRERRIDRWRYLWRLIWTPGASDVAAVQLPETLFPLYRVVRLGRLARKVLLRAES
jgi:hypothetical protein